MTSRLHGAVFLDRDGVLNRAVVRDGRPHPPSRVEDLEVLQGVDEALSVLVAAGYVLIGATNQPDVARGTQRREVVEEMNRALIDRLPLADILVCYHDDRDECDCRKPKPGLLLRGAARYSIDLSRSFLIGDRWKDIEAGHRAGCRTILIDYGYAETGTGIRPDIKVGSLPEAAAWILSQTEPGGDRG